MSTSWTIDNTRCNSKSLRIIDPSTGYAVADVFAHERLIAAAPDMASLLQEWQSFVLYGSSRRYTEKEMLDMTHATLAKAGL